MALDMVGIETMVHHWTGLPGRPQAETAALGRAFIAKAVFNLPTTRMLIERLSVDPTLRHPCGWSRRGEVPHETTFSRAFAEFANSALPSRLHQALITETQGERLIGHISRDATAIEGREKPVRKAAPETPKVARKRGRPKKGEAPPTKAPRRIEKQAAGMSLEAMLADLPNACDVGLKRNAKGHQETWIGYKLHIDTADGDIRVSCILTSASVHDSQVAIPLAVMTHSRVQNGYDLMDAAYDVPEIAAHSRSLGHVPIIDINPRRTHNPSRTRLKQALTDEAKAQRFAGHTTAEATRYHQRSSAERVNSAPKDNYGANAVRVRGPEKVMAHLMFGVIAVTVAQVMRLIQ